MYEEIPQIPNMMKGICHGIFPISISLSTAKKNLKTFSLVQSKVEARNSNLSSTAARKVSIKLR